MVLFSRPLRTSELLSITKLWRKENMDQALLLLERSSACFWQTGNTSLRVIGTWTQRLLVSTISWMTTIVSLRKRSWDACFAAGLAARTGKRRTCFAQNWMLDDYFLTCMRRFTPKISLRYGHCYEFNSLMTDGTENATVKVQGLKTFDEGPSGGNDVWGVRNSRCGKLPPSLTAETVQQWHRFISTYLPSPL